MLGIAASVNTARRSGDVWELKVDFLHGSGRAEKSMRFAERS